MNGIHLAALVLGAATVSAQATLRVVPERVQLDDGRDHQHLVVWSRTEAGIDVDVTRASTWTFAAPDMVAVDESGARRRLRPLRDGETGLRIDHDGQQVIVPIRITGTAVVPPISFANEVLPTLTHAGCNAGSCHGAAAGKNGFGLSLFAFDPARDHRVLTRELRARRVDPGQPETSLLLQKGSAAVPHQGGKRLPVDGDGHRAVLAWIQQGATSDVGKATVLVGIDLLPERAVAIAGQSLPMLLRARYADGTDRDVTALAQWSASNDAAAAVDREGVVTAKGAGESVILARYGGKAVTAPVIAHRDDAPFAWPAIEERNLVDTAVHERLRQLRLLPAEVCSDAVFVRRVHLDLLGLLPPPAVVTAFVADTAADKRQRLVDLLLQRPEFAAMLAMSWAEVLRVDGERMEAKGALRLTEWLRAQFAAQRPFDAIVRELLTTSGSSYAVPAASYWLAAEQPPQLAEHTAQVFLGQRIQCAQCHNHPFENWTMDDYYGFAAFFAQVGRKRGDDGAEWLLWDRRSGDVRNIKTGANAVPRLLGAAAPAVIAAGTDRRQVLADWLLAADNPWFARNVVNRVWARLFGRGIVEPPDDARISNPPSHPELLARLAALLIERQFDLRAVFSAICTSRTYQLARHAQDVPAAAFAGNQVRRLTAEQLLDAIGAVTGVPARLPGLPAGASASLLSTGRTGVRFLELFGRPAREGSCTCDRHDEPTLGQALHLLHGDTVAARLRDPNGRLRQWLQAGKEPTAMLDELFVLAYARPPRAEERAHLLGTLPSAGDADAMLAAWTDIAWAVLNSKEFLFQH
ncbi:MAG: DUF1553 domain-containing protein [Planctomycetes bacterium]|nr:DUF1553 domain-containing protein [Planctomycetota bacterium]